MKRVVPQIRLSKCPNLAEMNLAQMSSVKYGSVMLGQLESELGWWGNSPAQLSLQGCY